MSDTFRFSPSGPSIDASGGGAVESVFGRQGDIESETGDYTTDQVTNESTVSGATCTDALDTLSSSNARSNESSVPGQNVSDALDYLDANIAPPPRGRLFESFCGGQSASPITLPQNTGNVGDNGWNVVNLTSSSGWTVSRLPPEPGVVGAYRLTGCTSSAAAGGGPYLVFGELDNTQDDGPLLWGSVDELYFRARADPSPTGASGSVSSGWGVYGLESGGGTVSVGFNASIFYVPSSPNFTCHTMVNPGALLVSDTGVPIDDQWHEFIIRRVDATTIEFEIDGVVVATHSGGASIPSAASNATFVIYIESPDSPSPQRNTFFDIDTFEFTPA